MSKKNKKIKIVLWTLFSLIAPALVQLKIFNSTAYGGDFKVKAFLALYGIAVLAFLALTPVITGNLFLAENEEE